MQASFMGASEDTAASGAIDLEQGRRITFGPDNDNTARSRVLRRRDSIGSMSITSIRQRRSIDPSIALPPIYRTMSVCDLLGPQHLLISIGPSTLSTTKQDTVAPKLSLGTRMADLVGKRRRLVLRPRWANHGQTLSTLTFTVSPSTTSTTGFLVRPTTV